MSLRFLARRFSMIAILASAGIAAGSLVRAAPAGAEGARCIVSDGPDAARLKALDSAEAAECWLAREIPAGASLEDAPEFFEAADEVFFNAEENLWIYAYRSAATGKWLGWVAFDAGRTGVVHTAAVAGAH